MQQFLVWGDLVGDYVLLFVILLLEGYQVIVFVVVLGYVDGVEQVFGIECSCVGLVDIEVFQILVDFIFGECVFVEFGLGDVDCFYVEDVVEYVEIVIDVVDVFGILQVVFVGVVDGFLDFLQDWILCVCGYGGDGYIVFGSIIGWDYVFF